MAQRVDQLFRIFYGVESTEADGTLGTATESFLITGLPQMRLPRNLERLDGEPRLFRVAWREVARELPVYGDYVRRQIAQLGE